MGYMIETRHEFQRNRYIKSMICSQPTLVQKPINMKINLTAKKLIMCLK